MEHRPCETLSVPESSVDVDGLLYTSESIKGFPVRVLVSPVLARSAHAEVVQVRGGVPGCRQLARGLKPRGRAAPESGRVVRQGVVSCLLGRHWRFRGSRWFEDMGGQFPRLLVWPDCLTAARASKGRLRRHCVMASPPLTSPNVSTEMASMRKPGRSRRCRWHLCIPVHRPVQSEPLGLLGIGVDGERLSVQVTVDREVSERF